MIGPLVVLLERTLRGYGQMFLANNVVSGVLFCLGLMVASPGNGLCSLLGAVIFTLIGSRCLPDSSHVRSGLFGVNGVLLGYVFAYFPEVEFLDRLTATMCGSLLGALLLAVALKWCQRRQVRFVFFSLPYVLLAWASVVTLCVMGRADLHLFAGWSSLAAGASDQAREEFDAVQAKTPRVEAFAKDGAGWSAFRQAALFQQQYDEAAALFAEAAELSPTFADPHDGLGWCHFRNGDYEAATEEFNLAVQLDPWLADGWNGLGWTALLGKNDARQAAGDFARAARSAPLWADAYAGLYQSQSALEDTGSAKLSGLIYLAAQRYLAVRYQVVPLTQWICWLLFLVGLAWHSRISTLAALVAIAVCIAAAMLRPGLKETLSDINFVYNLLAIYIVCGGLYLRWGPATAAWTAILTVLLFLFWHVTSGTMPGSGLPWLCLPLNVVLAATVGLFSELKRRKWIDCTVPPDLAVTSPEEVRRWQLRRATADACWRLADAQAHHVGRAN